MRFRLESISTYLFHIKFNAMYSAKQLGSPQILFFRIIFSLQNYELLIKSYKIISYYK